MIGLTFAPGHGIIGQQQNMLESRRGNRERLDKRPLFRRLFHTERGSPAQAWAPKSLRSQCCDPQRDVLHWTITEA